MSMFPIASTISTGSTALFSFTNIPQTFTHLQVRVFGRTTYTGSENLFMRFNSTTYSFAGHHLNGNGSTANSSGYTGVSYMDLNSVPNSAQSSSIFGNYVIDILDYANTNKNKTIRCIGGWDGNGSGIVELTSGLLPTTSALTEITQLGGTAAGGSNVWAAGSRADLYGISTSGVTGA